MPKPVVLVQSWLPDDQLAPLSFTELVHPERGAPYLNHAEALAYRAHAILNHGSLRIDAELLQQMPDLKIVANMARGFDNFDVEAMTAAGVWGTNCTTSFTVPTAEVAMGLLLMTMRRMSEGDRFIRAGMWNVHEPGRWDGSTLEGKRLGIIGHGEIGKAIAKRARAFDMDVVYTQRTNTGDGWVSMDELLRTSDAVVVSVPLSAETFHLIDAEAMAKMKPGARLINIGRGPLVDELALVDALKSGHLGGAGLDVFEQEPKVTAALMDFPNVAVTPHVGGGTIESRIHSAHHAVANVVEVLQGRRPLTPVNEVPIRGE